RRKSLATNVDGAFISDRSFISVYKTFIGRVCASSPSWLQICKAMATRPSYTVRPGPAAKQSRSKVPGHRRHVAGDDDRIAGELLAEMAGDEPRVGVIGAARADRDDDGDGLAAVEVSVLGMRQALSAPRSAARSWPQSAPTSPFGVSFLCCGQIREDCSGGP